MVKLKYKIWKPSFDCKERLEQELKKLTSKTVEDCHEDIMNILELHDPQKYRKKVIGVLVVPFAMKDFYYRIAKDDNYKDKKSKLSAAEIKVKVEEMKLRREHEKMIREAGRKGKIIF